MRSTNTAHWEKLPVLQCVLLKRASQAHLLDIHREHDYTSTSGPTESFVTAAAAAKQAAREATSLLGDGFSSTLLEYMTGVHSVSGAPPGE